MDILIEETWVWRTGSQLLQYVTLRVEQDVSAFFAAKVTIAESYRYKVLVSDSGKLG